MPTAQKSQRTARFSYRHQLYGVEIRSSLPLPGPAGRSSGADGIRFFAGSDSMFSTIRQKDRAASERRDWFHHEQREDGSDYLRWSDLFEFLVFPDGRHIAYRPLRDGTLETFQTYLLGQVLSFALLKRGVEPLHATVIVTGGRAVALLGDCGYGKSSLGAAFLRAGETLLTDDLLVVEPQDNGRSFLAHPGPSRLKLFPDVATSLLGGLAEGVQMNPRTSKLVIPLPSVLSTEMPTALHAMYVLAPPAPGTEIRQVSIKTLSSRQACLALIGNTFNAMITDPDRLKRQFDQAASLAARVPVKSLAYPRDLGRLPAVVRAVQADLA
jgi:hypothetical protein